MKVLAVAGFFITAISFSLFAEEPNVSQKELLFRKANEPKPCKYKGKTYQYLETFSLPPMLECQCESGGRVICADLNTEPDIDDYVKKPSEDKGNE